MKESFYFSHDYNARSDIRIKKLLAKHEWTGYGIWWALVEDLYNNNNSLELDYELLSYDMRVDEAIIKSVIMDFKLFVIEDNTFYSLSVGRRLATRSKKREKAKKAAEARWGKSNKNNDADAMQPHNDKNIPPPEMDDEVIQPDDDVKQSDNEVKESKGGKNEGEETKPIDNKEVNASALQTHSKGNALKERKGKERKGEDSSSTPHPSPFKIKVRGRTNDDVKEIDVDVGLLESLKGKIPGLTNEAIRLSFERVKSYQRICPDRKIPKLKDLEYYLGNWMIKDLSKDNSNNYKNNGNNTSTVEEYKNSRAEFIKNNGINSSD